MYMYVQSLVSYASYQKAQCSVQGGTCCMPGCDNDTEPHIGGDMCSETGWVHQSLEGYDALCHSCDMMVSDYGSQLPEMTAIFYIRDNDGEPIGVTTDNDDALPF